MMKKIRISTLLLFVSFCFLAQTSAAQSSRKVAPIPGSLLLSGNFGELRTTHFHGGVDFRTGGVEGLPVVSVDDGIVSRIKVSGGGYGYALCVDHPDGTTSLYGHLQRYGAKLDSVVRSLQYRKESFDLDEDIKSMSIQVKRGEILAYSGNTGASGGPHLHFELRDSRSELVLNPLHDYQVIDLIAPKINAVYVYQQTPHGLVSSPRKVALRPVSGNKYVCDKLTLPAGKVGLGAWIIDYINGSANKLGVYHLTLKADGDTLFDMVVDTCSLISSQWVHAVKDFKLHKQGQTVYRCFGQHQNLLPGVRNKSEGLIDLQKDSTVVVEIIAADICGNKSVAKCTLLGGAVVDEPEGKGELLSGKRAYVLEAPGFSLRLDSNSLVSAVSYVARVEVDSIPNQRVFIVSEEEVPLLQKARLHFKGTFSDKTVLCYINGKGWKQPMYTLRDSTGLWSDVKFLGRYTVREDLEAPVITYLGVLNGRVRFRVKDNFTGVATYRGEVNGKWCLFVHNSKNNILSCSMKEPMFRRGQSNRITLVATDAVGNRSEYKGSVKY